MLDAFAIAVMLCALSPAVLFCVNLRRYRPPEAVGGLQLPMVSVLIPARDEAAAIAASLTGILASTGIPFEVVVMDDCSTDETAKIVQSVARIEMRVRLEHAPPLTVGWNGKQHACWELAHVAKGELLCFVDADVRLAPEALERMAAFLVQGDAALVSGFPREITVTWMEWLLLPLIHFVLLGFLPITKMRKGTDPAFAAGCGQFMMVQREAYFASGGHAAIRRTMHDGLLLPKLLRQHGYRTDLADLTALATCRMYSNARQVWQGLAKNATEGIAAPVRILPISLLVILGQVMPFAMAAWLWLRGGVSVAVTVYVLVAIAGAWLPRALAAARFKQDWRGALLHPVGIVMLLAVQWYALGRKLLGGAVSWKERSYVED
jgi:cellulose synthase/poly-beta-1,6-N-acetylglucosamine synthase-like glycosyltransferase